MAFSTLRYVTGCRHFDTCRNKHRQVSTRCPTLFGCVHENSVTLRTVTPATGFGMGVAFLMVVEGKHCAEEQFGDMPTWRK